VLPQSVDGNTDVEAEVYLSRESYIGHRDGEVLPDVIVAVDVTKSCKDSPACQVLRAALVRVVFVGELEHH